MMQGTSPVSGGLSSFLSSGRSKLADDSLTSAEDASSSKPESNLLENDKLSYSSNAESEELVGGRENSGGVAFRPSDDAEEQSQREPILSDDILCVVCAEVFLEPCTLHCGHSFCQLCLAALWKSSRKKSPLSLSCPVCRQPWVNFPGVNIQLRNIIEKTHNELVAKRRACHSDSDEALLLQFKKAVDGDWRRERQQNRHQQLRPVLGTVVIVALLGCALITIVLALISILALSGSSSEFVHKPVEHWSNEDVMDWLKGLGEWASTSNISYVFAKEKITGAQLKLLNASSLKSLGVHVDYFKSQSLLIALEKLKQKEYVQPRNFNEYMRVHRKQTVLVGVMYKFWPRFTILYLFFFEYEDLFFPLWQYSATSTSDQQWNMDELGPSMQQHLVFFVEVLLVPHYVVGLFAWQWFSEHPWLCTAVIIHCLWTTQSEAKKTVSFIMTLTQINWRLKFSQTVRALFKSVFKFMAALSGGLVMWPLVPYFMCTGLFYLVVWNTVYTQLLTVPWRWINARRQRVNLHPLQHALP